MNNEKYLYDFWGKIINSIYNLHIEFKKNMIFKTKTYKINKEFSDMLDRLSAEDKEILFEYLCSDAQDNIREFLAFFEEDTNFSLIYDTGTDLLDLEKINQQYGNSGTMSGEVENWINEYGIK